MSKIKITTAFVEKTKAASGERKIYWDTELPKFGIRIGEQSKVFFCEQRINGKNKRITLGKFPAMSVNNAKRHAILAFAEMANGVDINASKKSKRIEGVTLRAVFEDYIESRNIMPGTIKQYRYAMIGYQELLDTPIQAISKDDIERIHKQVGNEIGAQTANKYGRHLKAIFNYAKMKYEIDGKPVLAFNPVDRLSETRLWNRSERRTGHLKAHELPALFDALDQIPNQTVADYIRFVLFTGCRRSEVAALEWKDVNLTNKSFRISIDPKNHQRIELPLTDTLLRILRRRRWCQINAFVFSAKSTSGHIMEPKKTVKKLGEQINHHFTLHDLRRTYITIAAALDIPHYALKALVNHKMDSSDITANYVITSVDNLREPMRRITDFMLKQA